MIKELLQALVFGLLPPELPLNENGPPSPAETLIYRKAKRKWNKTVALALWSVLLFGGFHVSWACGWLESVPGFRGSGFALADELADGQQQVAQVASQLETIAINQLRSQLLETRRMHCDAIADVAAGVADARQRRTTYFNEMERLKEQYRLLRKEAWLEPACDAL